MSDIDVLPAEGAAHEGALQPEADISPGGHRTHARDAGHARQRPTAIDLASYLLDISADQPCGPDLQYDADYIELARIMQGTPEVEYGGMRIEAADPDWKAAKALALKLLARTLDLRLAVWLTRILLGLHGFAGLDDGLALIEGCIERKWDSVHPVPDPSDDNDPTERLNILASLGDDGLLRQVKLAALARSELHGRACLRDVDLAAGELEPRVDDEVKSMAVIAAAFHGVDLSELMELVCAIEDACLRLDRIESAVGERVRHAGAGVEKLSRLLRHAAKVVQGQLDAHPGEAPRASAFTDIADIDCQQAPADEATACSGTLESRDDVVRQIDRICDYYMSAEPGSPVPVLLQRAKRLVNMNFIELMSELSPQGLAEISFLLGVRVQGNHPDADVPEAYSTFNGEISG